MSGAEPRTRYVLGLFAKWPKPGAVKTRLGAPDPSWGARVAHAFLRDTVTRLSRLPVERLLVYSPPDAVNDFADLAQGLFRLVPQQLGDLGARLGGFFQNQFRTGENFVVAVGTDSPTLPVDYVRRAFRELERADVVLGPALDGGYYLVGCRRWLPALFEDIPWSTSRVLAETVARLADPCLRLRLLPPWYDVDTPEDWALLLGHLAALRRAGRDPGTPLTETLAEQTPP